MAARNRGQKPHGFRRYPSSQQGVCGTQYSPLELQCPHNSGYTLSHINAEAQTRAWSRLFQPPACLPMSARSSKTACALHVGIWQLGMSPATHLRQAEPTGSSRILEYTCYRNGAYSSLDEETFVNRTPPTLLLLLLTRRGPQADRQPRAQTGDA